FGRIVLDIDAAKFDQALEAQKKAAQVETDPKHSAKQLEDLVTEYKAIVRKETGKPFPTEPQEQLRLAIEAVFGSWFGQRAKDYRKQFKISDDLGTACSVVTMVFGNMGDDSGSGVAFTRAPNSGAKELSGEDLTNEQGRGWCGESRTRTGLTRHPGPRPDGPSSTRTARLCSRVRSSSWCSSGRRRVPTTSTAWWPLPGSSRRAAARRRMPPSSRAASGCPASRASPRS